MRYQSNALWPPGVCHSKWNDNISVDTHETEDQARGVCFLLASEGFGGKGKVFPLKTWISDIQDPPVLPEHSSAVTVTEGWPCGLSNLFKP